MALFEHLGYYSQTDKVRSPLKWLTPDSKKNI
jgi:hypothetical protein